jgi:quercetin dioxygenase-like cupin family protein
MVIDFDAIEPTRLENFNGGTGVTVASMFADEHNRIMRGYLAPGASIGDHAHGTSSEIMYALEGSCTVWVDDGAPERVTAGMCHYCPKGHAHRVVNDTDENLYFLTVITQQ